MIKLQKKSYILLAVLFTLLTLFSIWVAIVNATSYVLIPLLSLLLLALLLIAFCLARESWFSENFKWEELRAAVLVILAINLASSALLLIVSEMHHIDNTLGGLSLFRFALLIGAPVGVMLWVKLAKTFDKKNIVMLKVFLISFALITATAGSQLNRKYAKTEESIITIDVLQKEGSKSNLASYLTQKEEPFYIFIQNQDDAERLVIPEVVWNDTYQYASIDLSVKQGYFGYPYVLSFDGRVLQD